MQQHHSMDKREEVKISKFLSRVLRHSPEIIGIRLDENGWVNIKELLEKSKRKGMNLDLEKLCMVVQRNDKQRFALNFDQTRIRASQGHSFQVNLGYESQTPPDTLYHGTASKNLDSIRRLGLLRGSRHHVHLSAAYETARQVGSRHGNPLVLTVLSGVMSANGIPFWLSDNGVWLTDYVAIEYIDFDWIG